MVKDFKKDRAKNQSSGQRRCIRWTQREHNSLKEAVHQHGTKSWAVIAWHVETKNAI